MQNKNNVVKIELPESEIPKQWYNIVSDFKNPPAPYFNPANGEGVQPSDMQAIFPDELIAQEMSSDRYIDIPNEVREMYKSFRPSPMFRARGLEKALGTPARIYYKYEGGNATGSHKLNTALAQAYYNKQAGIKRIATETGAGQWGTAISMAANHFGMDCTVYMVKVSYEQKPYRKIIMKTFGAEVFSSPTNLTNCGRTILANDPDCTGSLGIAIAEAVEDAATHNDTNYSLGSVLNHVILHQTVIGQECKKQLDSIDEYPDIVIACCGGGSNFGGTAFPFAADKLKGTSNVRLLAVEPASCPTLTKGIYTFDYGDTGKMTPIMKMYTLGHDFIPEGIYAGGLRYHGDSPLVSQLYNEGYIEAIAYQQNSILAAGIEFAKAEGIIPAPESSHAVRAAIEEAKICRETGESKCILFTLSGNGYFDLTAYENFINEKTIDVDFNVKNMEKATANLPHIKQ